MKKNIWLVAAGVGIVNAVLLDVFEYIGIDVTNWLWNDLFHTDTQRWVLLPLAVGLSIILTAVCLRFGSKRLIEPVSDLMEEMNVSGVKIRDISIILGIGAVSLLAGASLGPEAALMAASAAIGAWSASRYHLNPAKNLVILASVGALLVAFFGSLLPLLVPLLLLAKKKQLKLASAAVVTVAGVLSFITIQIIDHASPGYGTGPTLPQLVTRDYWVALVVGFVTALLAMILNKLITLFWKVGKGISARVPWYVAAGVFGLVLGGLYLFGGRSDEFSGSIGTQLLLSHTPEYGVLALLGLLAVKLFATAWSKGTGYRGGLVFPSIYMGTALGLMVGQFHTEWAGAGAIIGAIAGVMSAVIGSPIVAGIFVISILPMRVLPVALIAIAATAVASKLEQRFTAKRAPHSSQS